jgi:gluconate 5-dehydrogenase
LDVDALVELVLSDTGRLDAMVCNAGEIVAVRDGEDPYLEDVPTFVDGLEACLTSTYNTARGAAQAMTRARGGSIVTVGSIHSCLGVDHRLMVGSGRSGISYKAAKGGVLSLTRALACELGPFGIRVNCVSPGRIPQDRSRHPEVDERFADRTPLKKLGTPRDVAGAVALLASDAGRWITGAELVVDGGWSAW